jgi:oligoendopeptidase F
LSTKIKKRSELLEKDTWKLEDIFTNDEAWERAYQACAEKVAGFARHRGALGSRDALKAALDHYYDAVLGVSSLMAYARMRRDEDTTRTQYQALTDRAMTLAVNMSAASSFLTPELIALSPQYLADCANDPAFSAYRMFFIDIERARPHTLSAEEERIIAMAGELGTAPGMIYDMLTDADMKFPDVPDGKGGKTQLTQGNYAPLLMNPDRAVRKAAFTAMYETFRGYSASVPAIYAASVKADLFAARTAKFDSALEASLYANDIPLAVYENLIAAVRGRLGALDRLMCFSAKLLGIRDPAMYDVYARQPGEFAIDLPFEEAYALVVRALAPLGAKYQNTLERALRERWIDPHQNEGKASGAYAWGTYETHPYVLLNYHENLEGLLTIAHEMGHAMHSFLSNRAQSAPMADYSLFVAEVASTVNEVLVLMHLMEQHTEKPAQAYLLNNLLQAYRTTLFRQTMFAEFEKSAHEMVQRGEALTADNLNDLYAALNRAYYPSFEQTDLIQYEWMRIPHFYRAFYVYQYATGFSAAMAIAGMIRDEGPAAVERYTRFLSAGGSLYPIEALKLAGVDMSSPEPVERALDLFEELIARYEVAAG